MMMMSVTFSYIVLLSVTYSFESSMSLQSAFHNKSQMSPSSLSSHMLFALSSK